MTGVKSFYSDMNVGWKELIHCVWCEHHIYILVTLRQLCALAVLIALLLGKEEVVV